MIGHGCSRSCSPAPTQRNKGQSRPRHACLASRLRMLAPQRNPLVARAQLEPAGPLQRGEGRGRGRESPWRTARPSRARGRSGTGSPWACLPPPLAPSPPRTSLAATEGRARHTVGPTHGAGQGRAREEPVRLQDGAAGGAPWMRRRHVLASASTGWDGGPWMVALMDPVTDCARPRPPVGRPHASQSAGARAAPDAVAPPDLGSFTATPMRPARSGPGLETRPPPRKNQERKSN